MSARFLALGLLLGICGCSRNDAPTAREDKPRPAGAERSVSSKQKQGLANATAMVENAALCEPSIGTGDIRACERACELNHSNSCANWGALVEAVDPTRAFELFERSCVGGSGIGCEHRARVKAARGDADSRDAYVTARNYHRVHCSQGYARSCRQLAALHEQGLGGEANASVAREFRRRACKLEGQTSCP